MSASDARSAGDADRSAVLDDGPVRERLGAFQGRALVLGSGATALLVVIAFAGVERAMQAWLVAFFLWFGVALGSLALLMLHNVTGGGWGHAVRRVLEAGTKTLPVTALFALPFLVFPGVLYEWAHPAVVAADPILQHKAAYLNVPFFRVRGVLYFAIWIGLAALCRALGRTNERERTEASGRRLRAISAPGIAVFGATLTFAAIDWGMSLEPHWFSTMYGVLFIVGQALSTLCFSILVAGWLARREPIARYFGAGQFHDLGNLVLAFVMLWAYTAFSQFLIIWSANLSEETPWYLHRLGHGWEGLALCLLLLHFAVPFALLLSRRTKRSRSLLPALAAFLFVLRYADLHWLLVPAFERESALLGFAVDLLALVAAGGLWLGAFLHALRSGPLYSEAPGRAVQAASHA